MQDLKVHYPGFHAKGRGKGAPGVYYMHMWVNFQVFLQAFSLH